MKTIEIDNELILVEVPKDASDFYTLLSSNELVYKLSKKWVYTGIICKIIGIIETPNVDFDFDVELNWVFSEGYEMFTNENMDETKRKLFRTRIQSKIQDAGLYLVNPICNPFYIKQIGENMRTSTYIADWQFKEEKTIKGNLLLIKKLQ